MLVYSSGWRGMYAQAGSLPGRAVAAGMRGGAVVGAKEWSTNGGGAGSWLKLTWSSPVTLATIVLYDRPNLNDQITSRHPDLQRRDPDRRERAAQRRVGADSERARCHHQHPHPDHQLCQPDHPERGPGRDRGV